MIMKKAAKPMIEVLVTVFQMTLAALKQIFPVFLAFFLLY